MVSFAMGELRKITVQVDCQDLQQAQELTGEGVTETVRAALKRLAQVQAQRDLAKLRGKIEFSMSLDDLRYDRE